MKLTFSGERILAVVAHPDDAELLCAGTLARAKMEGAVIGIAVLCNGDKGQPSKPIKNLADVRRKEMRAAAKLLGAELSLGEFSDATLSDAYPWRTKVIDTLRRFNPTLVIAHAPEDYHVDHQAASKLVEMATWSCASRGHKTKLPPMDAPPSLWFMDTINMSGFMPEFYVDVSRYFEVKEQMLNCHKSQLARGEDGDFSPLTDLMRLQFRARGMQSDVFAAEAFRAYRAFKRLKAW
jgi:N-acetylglucosamine malate deacetylase 1